ncbi:MAG: DUF1294 domain-containing protein [Chloroflexota bacterium]|nr:MAG: DUF1294 domain-containing protein [Chloroflexota bacterium]
MKRHPFLFYAILFFGLTLAGTLAIWWILKWDIVLAWLISIMVVTLFAYRFDKGIAGSERTRVPERILLLLALAGGSLGAILGMFFIGDRHKTSKTSFMLPFIGILIVQAILVGIYFWRQFQG